nr:copper homeostasis protein CutC [Acetatifactor sp.]
MLEVCIDSVASVRAAIEGGANRLEVSGNLVIGGTTPSPELFRRIREITNIPLRVLLRPRFGDFCYDEEEFHILCREAMLFKELGADGIVIGILKPDGTLNLPQMKELIKAADDMDITLHRAFDVCKDPYRTIEEAISLGIDTILTSGQKNTAWEGRELLADLQSKYGNEIELLAGAGIQAQTIKELYPITKITSYHMSGKISKESTMQY